MVRDYEQAFDPIHDIRTGNAVFTREGDMSWRASDFARGPWDPRAQHGGAPCGLLAHLAESALGEPGWHLARLTVELVRPVRSMCSRAPILTQQRLIVSRGITATRGVGRRPVKALWGCPP